MNKDRVWFILNRFLEELLQNDIIDGAAVCFIQDGVRITISIGRDYFSFNVPIKNNERVVSRN